MSCCTKLNDRFDGVTVDDLLELKAKLEEVHVDSKEWVTNFRCLICGQIWIEQYESKGHGDVPVVYKKLGSVQ